MSIAAAINASKKAQQKTMNQIIKQGINVRISLVFFMQGAAQFSSMNRNAQMNPAGRHPVQPIAVHSLNHLALPLLNQSTSGT